MNVMQSSNNFLKQMDKIESLHQDQQRDFFTLVATQMEALLATTMIEYNGIHFDVLSAADVAATLAAEHDILTEKLQRDMSMWINKWVCAGDPPVIPKDCNPSSTQQLSAVIAGGTFKHIKKGPMLDENGDQMLVKSGPNKGTVRMKNYEYQVLVTGMVEGKPHHLENTAHGYRLDESALKKLIEEFKGLTTLQMSPTDLKLEKLVMRLLKHRSLQKELKTSYMGLLELAWPTDSCIHGNMNHCATNTGRLSSSAPNQQNFSAKEVKE